MCIRIYSDFWLRNKQSKHHLISISFASLQAAITICYLWPMTSHTVSFFVCVCVFQYIFLSLSLYVYRLITYEPYMSPRSIWHPRVFAPFISTIFKLPANWYAKLRTLMLIPFPLPFPLTSCHLAARSFPSVCLSFHEDMPAFSVGSRCS